MQIRTEVPADWDAIRILTELAFRDRPYAGGDEQEGIGSELIRAGLKRIEALGAQGCILTRNPNYYQRFGFEVRPEHAPSNEPPESFMVKLLGGSLPDGTFSFHRAFYGDVS